MTPPLSKIITIEIKELQERLHDKNIKLHLSEKAKEFLIEKGFDPVFGARPLKRTIQRFVEDPLSEEIIAGRFKKGVTITIDAKVDHLTFEKDK